jgi:4,4'-diaponeurosporenoate glycosyltransferase
VIDLVMLLRLAVGLGGYYIFNARMRTCMLRGRAEAPLTSTQLDVSLIVPARNEAANLPALLTSIAALQPAPREVIVVDDHSTDDTAAIAASFGARVVSPGPLPVGWVGKAWACAAGAAEASSSVLLFTDADTVHSKDLLGRAAAALEGRRADLVSVLPTHLAVSVWERFQGIFQLLTLIAGGAGCERMRGERCFCIGQYLLIRRAAYARIGGHAAVRHRVAEDIGMAWLIERFGLRFELVRAPGALKVRMYPEGLGAFIRGWRRNFREGMRTAGLIGTFETGLVIGWLLDVPRWFVQACWSGNAASIVLATAAGLVTWATIAYWQREAGAFRARHALGYPALTLLFVWISCLAVADRALRRPVAWRGRSIPLDELQ